MTDYPFLKKQLESLIKGVPYLTASLANSSSFLFNNLDDVSWVGFYFLLDDKLVLNAFQGKPACIELPLGKGVCASAFMRDGVVIVDDVHDFDGHIACDELTNSEIALPIHKDDKVIGVLDIDSYSYRRFDEETTNFLKEVVLVLEKELKNIF